jgi:hypothetical protein
VNDDISRFRLVRSQLRKIGIAPFSKAYHLSVVSFPFRELKQFQKRGALGGEIEGMTPKQFAELRDCWMALGKHVLSKLSQGLSDLGFVQLIFGMSFLPSGYGFLAL